MVSVITSIPEVASVPILVSSFEKPTVYVVEDDNDLRQSVIWILEGAGYRVDGSPSARHLLETYDPKRFGCLLLDLHLPDMNGLDLREELLSLGCRHPFLILTGHGDVGMAVKAFHKGAIDFLEKPCDRKRLLTSIERAIESDRATRGVQRRLETLTDREREVLELVVTGSSGKHIAQRLGISTRTVDVHRSNIVKKMGVESSAALIHVLSKQALPRD